ncbi:MAG: thiamine pyrophosphate-dependent enzyme, partial [Candidatus Lokiarchaeota archaeon]
LTTLMGLGAISINQNTYAGSYPIVSTFRRAASEADVILSLGCKWDYTVLYGFAPVWDPEQKVIQVDIDSNEIGKNRPIEVGIIADIKAFINLFLKELEVNLPKEKVAEWSQWNQYLQDARKNDETIIEKILSSDKEPMKPQRFVIEVLRTIQPETLLVIDGGDIALFTYGLISNFQRFPRSTFQSLGMGHLGVGICFAIGSKLAKPDKPVVCISGDGSFLFNVQELETAVRLNLPLIILIANNCAWGMIKTKQKNAVKKRFCDVDLPKTNYAEIAKSFGCYAEKVDKPEEIAHAIKRAIDSKKPSVIDVDVAYESPTGGKFLGIYKKNKGLFGK